MAAIPAKYQPLVERFIAPYRKNPEVAGIVVTGSVVHGDPDKNSDVDVQIILRKGDWRERGNTWIGGVEFEYFMNPIAQIREYLKTETDKHTAHMLAHGIVVFERSKEIGRLIVEARKVLTSRPAPMTGVEIENAKYSLDDQKKDLEDVYLRGDAFGFNLVASQVISDCIRIFCKAKRIVNRNGKRLQAHISAVDPAFAKLLHASLIEKDDRKRYRNLRQLVAYTESLVGGPRPREWKLRGPLKRG